MPLLGKKKIVIIFASVALIFGSGSWMLSPSFFRADLHGGESSALHVSVTTDAPVLRDSNKELSYDIAYSNTGTKIYDTLTLTNDYDETALEVMDIPSECIEDSGEIVCHLPPLAPGENREMAQEFALRNRDDGGSSGNGGGSNGGGARPPTGIGVVGEVLICLSGQTCNAAGKQQECEGKNLWFYQSADFSKTYLWCEDPAAYGLIIMETACMPLASGGSYHFFFGPYANRTMLYRRAGSCDPMQNPALCDISDGTIQGNFSESYSQLSQQFQSGQHCDYTPEAAIGSCDPGSASANSPDGSNTCIATWSRIYNGQTASLPGISGSVTGGGSVTATCLDGAFQVQRSSCPNISPEF